MALIGIGGQRLLFAMPVVLIRQKGRLIAFLTLRELIISTHPSGAVIITAFIFTL